MRAAYAAGVLAAFEESGVRPFDAVYGTSAGGALVAWWSARQAVYALGTWKYAQDRRILSWRRFLTRRGPFLDHDTLFRVVYEQEHPLDIAAVERAPHPIIVNAVDVDRGEVVYADVRRGPVLAWLRATGRLPLGTGPAVEIDGRRFVDGGVAEPVMLQKAIDDGARDVTVVFNRPRAMREPESRLATRLTARYYPHIEAAVRHRHEVYNAAVALAEAPPAGVRVRVVRPATDTGVRRFTRDLELIDRCIARGRVDGRAVAPGLP